MIRDRCAQPVAVAQFGCVCSSGLARAALRRNWTILNADEPGFVRRAMTQGVKVLVVQADEASADALALVKRLSMHWNPVSCVVVGPAGGMDLELSARRAGAAAYVAGGADVEVIESLVSGLASRSSGTAIAK